MRGVEQVVNQPEVVAVDLQLVSGGDVPARLAMVVDLDHWAGLRQGCIAHPDPQQAVFVLHRVGPHFGKGRNTGLCGGIDALASAVESEPVVAALDGIALDAPHGQGQFAVGAGVLKCCGQAALHAVQHNSLAQQSHRLGRTPYFGGQCRNIPSVLQKL